MGNTEIFIFTSFEFFVKIDEKIVNSNYIPFCLLSRSEIFQTDVLSTILNSRLITRDLLLQWKLEG